MSTSRATSRSQLPSSDFPITPSIEGATGEFEVQIEAQHLGLNYISEANQERHDIILSLHWHRYTPAEIATYLNRLGIKTPRGKTYYAKLVEVTRRKLLLRKKRREEVTVRVSGTSPSLIS